MQQMQHACLHLERIIRWKTNVYDEAPPFVRRAGRSLEDTLPMIQVAALVDRAQGDAIDEAIMLLLRPKRVQLSFDSL